MSDADGDLLPHGGNEHLRSYKVAEAAYVATPSCYSVTVSLINARVPTTS